MYQTKTHLRVRYVETDQMGIVHHSKYAPYLEVARTEFIASLGKTYRSMEQEGVMLPLIDLTCRYLNVARYDDLLLVVTRLTELTPVRCRFDYQIYLEESGKLIHTGSTSHAFVSSESFRPMNGKKHFPEVFQLLEQHLSEKEDGAWLKEDFQA